MATQTVIAVTRPAATITRERYERLAARVKLLSWLSLAWMTVEGAVAIAAGVAAGSIALVGFGLDSAIEGFASVIIIWRFTGDRVFSHVAEQRAVADRVAGLLRIQPRQALPRAGKEVVDGRHRPHGTVVGRWPRRPSSR